MASPGQRCDHRPDSGVETAATGSEVGDLFEYRIDQPDGPLRDFRSALIPILQTRMEGERVSILTTRYRRGDAMRAACSEEHLASHFRGRRSYA